MTDRKKLLKPTTRRYARIKTRCISCCKVRYVSGKHTQAEAKKIRTAYVCSDCDEEGKGSR